MHSCLEADVIFIKFGFDECLDQVKAHLDGHKNDYKQQWDNQDNAFYDSQSSDSEFILPGITLICSYVHDCHSERTYECHDEVN